MMKLKSVFGVFRVLGLAAALLGIAGAWTSHRAEAHLLESMRGFGQELARIDGFEPRSAPRRLMLNGLEMGVTTITTPLAVAEALNRFQAACHSVAQLDLPTTVRQKMQDQVRAKRPVDAASLLDGVIRKDTDHEGLVACIDLGNETTGEGLLNRLVEFGKTGNLRSLGQMRYAMARRSADTTTLLLVWSHGDTKLTELFPKTGDAPGVDLRDVPRPKGARRVLSAFEAGVPYVMASYVVEGRSLKDVMGAYERDLDSSGWHRQMSRPGTLLVEKAGRRVVVRMRERTRGAVSVSFSDLG